MKIRFSVVILVILLLFSNIINASVDYKPINVKGEIDLNDPSFVVVEWDNPENVLNDEKSGIISNVKLNIDYKIDENSFVSETGGQVFSFDINQKKVRINPFIQNEILNAFNSRVTFKLYYSYVKDGKDTKSVSFDTIELGHNSFIKGGRSWSKKDVNIASDLGLIVDSMKEDISKEVSRYEFIKMLMRLDEHIGKHEFSSALKFSDTDDVDVNNALNLGIVKGGWNNRFNGQSFLTKEAMSTIIYRYLTINNKLDEIKTTDYNLVDLSEVSSWAQEAVTTLASKGVIKGDDKGLILPKFNVTREQAIVMVVRLLNIN